MLDLEGRSALYYNLVWGISAYKSLGADTRRQECRPSGQPSSVRFEPSSLLRTTSLLKDHTVRQSLNDSLLLHPLRYIVLTAECRRIGASIIRGAQRIEQLNFCVFVGVLGFFF